jgi:hypothetical protein
VTKRRVCAAREHLFERNVGIFFFYSSLCLYRDGTIFEKTFFGRLSPKMVFRTTTTTTTTRALTPSTLSLVLFPSPSVFDEKVNSQDKIRKALASSKPTWSKS